MAIRPLNQQFSKPKADSIRALINRLRMIDYPKGASRQYSYELCTCLEAGALLASVHVASTLLEMVLRSLVIERAAAARKNSNRAAVPSLEKILEEKREIRVPALLDALIAAGLFDCDDAHAAKQFYREVRIPILHGLTGRFVRQFDPAAKVLQDVVLELPTSSQTLEEVIEDEAIPLITLVIDILERNVA